MERGIDPATEGIVHIQGLQPRQDACEEPPVPLHTGAVRLLQIAQHILRPGRGARRHRSANAHLGTFILPPRGFRPALRP